MFFHKNFKIYKKYMGFQILICITINNVITKSTLIFNILRMLSLCKLKLLTKV